MKEETFDSIRDKGLLVYDYQRGSYVYNLQRPDGQSDIDTAGVYQEPLEWMFMVESYPEQIKDEKGDTVWYTLRKYFMLLYSMVNLKEDFYERNDYSDGMDT